MAYENRTKPHYATTAYRAASAGSCTKTLGSWTGYVNVLDSYQTVTSWRGKRPKRNGFVAPHQFFVQKFFVDDATNADFCFLPTKRRVESAGLRPLFRPSLHLSPEDFEELYHLVRQNVEADIFAKANSPAVFDLAPVLFEAKETLGYVWKLFKGMSSVVKMLFQGGGTSAFLKALSAPENLWLEYRYAIMPLILTISDAIDAYKGGTVVKSYDTRLEIKAEYEYKDPSWGYDGIHPFGVTHSGTDSVSATARLYVESQCDPAPLGTGIWDVLRGGWEVVPLSFVFNWFFGVEEWLTSMRNTNLSLRGSYSTLVVDRVGRYFIDDYKSENISYTKEWSGNVKDYYMGRVIDIKPPSFPLLQAERLSALRTVDAISLIISFMKGILSHRK